MHPTTTNRQPKTIREIALWKYDPNQPTIKTYDLEAAKLQKEEASRKHDIEVAKKKLSSAELDRAVYGRCATTKAHVVFHMADGSEIEGRILDSSRFCVIVELEGVPVRRRLLYKHAIVSVAFPASEHPVEAYRPC